MTMEKPRECHGHIMMFGEDYRASFERMSSFGITYFRDGGDAEGVTADAKRYAEEHPELGIEYVTPVFATHRKGRYGGIVGKPFESLKEFRELISEADALGADFVKIMFSGIATFQRYGELSCPPLDAAEIKELVNIAHGEGFAVMSHTNGREAFLAAVEAGTDSIEHGLYIDEECLCALAESDSIWVPTLAAIVAFSGRTGRGEEARYHNRPGFDPVATRFTAESHMASVKRGAQLGAKIAAGSDCGAFGVPAGSGTLMEYELLDECGLTAEAIEEANELIRTRFKRAR